MKNPSIEHNSSASSYICMFCVISRFTKYLKSSSAFRNMKPRKHILVVGAGCAGLVALKTCLEYDFDVVCLEKTDGIGGLWRYKPEYRKGESSVMKNTICNTSKEMMAFSDYPPPAHFPNYMSNSTYLEYLRLYVTHFDLSRHIRFRVELLSVEHAEHHDKTGRWKVTSRDLSSNRIQEEIFDAVMICTGHYSEPYIPAIEGLDRFPRVMHSVQYKDFHGFEDKRVIVVGMGNSGCDIASELTHVCKKVFLSTNHGNWVDSRLTTYGYPTDFIWATRYEKLKAHYFPNWASAQREDRLSRSFDHSFYGIRPSYRARQQISVVNDHLPYHILNGTILVKPSIDRVFEDGTVVFRDESSEQDIDAIIFATGFSISFPYLKQNGNLTPIRHGQVSLYMHMYVPDLAHPETLPMIGCVQPGGSHVATAEMQARVACEALSESIQLPSADEMQADIQANLRGKQGIKGRTEVLSIVENYMGYMDSLAELIDVKPRIANYLFSDPYLAIKLMFGPFLPYQFRLRGPRQWSGARNAIVTVWDRVRYPTEKKVEIRK